MARFVAILQLLVAALMLVLAVATLVNLVLIAGRPETISVVNAMIGQGVLIIALLVVAHIFSRKGLAKLRDQRQDAQDSADEG